MKFPSRQLLMACCIPLMSWVLLPVALAAESNPAGKEKSNEPMVRFLCVNSLSDSEDVIVASKSPDDEWIEHGTVPLRSSFITPWTKAAPGRMHLTRRKGEGLVSIGSFKIPENTRRSIVVLLPDTAKDVYKADFIDPKEFGFKKGMALVTNYSKVSALVMMGSKRTEVKPGKRVAARAVAGEDGMYRMVVGYQDETKELVPCYDRYISANPDARDILLLFPDATTGLRVYSLSEFGPFE